MIELDEGHPARSLAFLGRRLLVARRPIASRSRLGRSQHGLEAAIDGCLLRSLGVLTDGIHDLVKGRDGLQPHAVARAQLHRPVDRRHARLLV